MSGAFWDGVTRAESFKESVARDHQALADAARVYDWGGVLAILEREPSLVNSVRLGGTSRYTPLHQAAHGGAATAVVERLLALGSWRLARNAAGERPLDVAIRRSHTHLVPLLTPVLQREVPLETLQALQTHFHALIRQRVDSLVQEHALRLPELEVLLELPEPRAWFPVPGMYGGFSYRLSEIGEGAVLVVESWIRVVGGSGQCHVISPFGSLLVAEGFV